MQGVSLNGVGGTNAKHELVGINRAPGRENMDWRCWPSWLSVANWPPSGLALASLKTLIHPQIFGQFLNQSWRSACLVRVSFLLATANAKIVLGD